jgi:hypothetical protein
MQFNPNSLLVEINGRQQKIPYEYMGIYFKDVFSRRPFNSCFSKLLFLYRLSLYDTHFCLRKLPSFQHYNNKVTYKMHEFQTFNLVQIYPKN